MKKGVIGKSAGQGVLPRMASLQPPGGPLLDLAEAAEYLGVSVRWMRRVMTEHRVATVNLGRRVKVSKATLDDFVASNTRPANGSAAPGLVSLSPRARSKRPESHRERTTGADRGSH